MRKFPLQSFSSQSWQISSQISATGILAKYGEQEDVGEEIDSKNEKTMTKRDVSDGHND